jgi:hypothetical protein
VEFVQNFAATGLTVDTNNTVTVSTTGTADVYKISVTLDASAGIMWSFQKDPTGQGHEASFGFADTANLAAFTSISSGFSENVSARALTTQFVIQPITWGGQTTSTGYAYGVSTASQQTYSTLSFLVTTTDATLTAFINSLIASNNGSLSIFAADVYDAANGKTGAIGFTQCLPGQCPSTTVTTPLPGAVALFAGGLGLFGIAGIRRKRGQRRLMALEPLAS